MVNSSILITAFAVFYTYVCADSINPHGFIIQQPIVLVKYQFCTKREFFYCPFEQIDTFPAFQLGFVALVSPTRRGGDPPACEIPMGVIR
jgi:hypothetical protein